MIVQNFTENVVVFYMFFTKSNKYFFFIFIKFGKNAEKLTAY